MMTLPAAARPGADGKRQRHGCGDARRQNLAAIDFGCTLRFVNFSGEEQGLVGSAQYAKDAYCARKT
jgi:Zn-dependent M28 family amino/carboxypeptidase